MEQKSSKNTTLERLQGLKSQIQHGQQDEYEPKRSLKSQREKSTVDQEFLKKFMFGKNYAIRDKVYDIIVQNQDIFTHHFLEEHDRKGQREASFIALKTLFEKMGLGYDDYKRDPNIITMASYAQYSYDPAVSVKFGVHFHLYIKTIINLGSSKHDHLIEKGSKMDDIGCFALTEIGHGSNVRGIWTTAHYDEQTKEFIINTPHELATKFWIGGSAQMANMAVVWAQLQVKDKCYGVHAFIVPIRTKANHTLMPGVIIGDCGAKVGLDGIDNGFFQFSSMRIPRDNLLDRFSQVSESGEFTTSIKNDDKRFGIQLGSLSGGRVLLSIQSMNIAINALTTSVRYACIRRQFGAPNKPEQHLIEYPLTQYRLLPMLAASYVYTFGGMSLCQRWDSNQQTGILFDLKNPLLAELHAVSSVTKSISSWFAAFVAAESRQLLGGHGFSKYNRLGALYNDNDVNMTWEGDNNVLLQQTAKFILDNLKKKFKGSDVPHESLKFLSLDPVESKRLDVSSTDDLLKIETIKAILEHRANLLIQRTALRVQENITKYDPIEAWNATQPLYANNMAKAYGHVQYCNEFINNLNLVSCTKTHNVLKNCLLLWGYNLIIEDLGTVRENDYLSTEQAQLIRNLILDLCRQLKDEAVGLIDVLAPPDEIHGSVFGSYDGDIYNRYITRIFSAKSTFERPSWWRIIHGKNK